MAKGFKQASDSLNGEKTAERVEKSTVKAEAVSSSPRETAPASGVKFGKGFSSAKADLNKTAKSDENVRIEHAEPIRHTETVKENDFKTYTAPVSNTAETKKENTSPQPKKKSKTGLIIGIAAAVVVFVAVGGGAATQLSKGIGVNRLINTSSSVTDGSSTQGTSQSTSGTSQSTSAGTAVKSGSYVDKSDQVFKRFSGQAHSFETQELSLIGMTVNEQSHYDKTSVTIPAEMEGEDKKLVGSINPSGTKLKWSNSRSKNVSGKKTSVTIKYGTLNSETSGILKSYLNEFKSEYSEQTKSYVVEYKGNGSSKQSNTTESVNFKEICKKSFDDIEEVLKNADVQEYSFEDDSVYVYTKNGNSSILEDYYYDDNICAMEMVISKPLHTSVEVKMVKIVNCGDSVRAIYCDYFNNSSTTASGLANNEKNNLYEIEQTMIKF